MGASGEKYIDELTAICGGHHKLEVADWREKMEKPTRLTEPLGTLPAEHWEIDASIYGALADNLSAYGLLMLSIRDMPVGARLYVRIFYAKEYELDWITAEVNIISKDRHITEEWKGHKYQLQFVQLSEENRLKLKDFLDDRSKQEHAPAVQDRIADGSCRKEAVFAPLSDSGSTTLEPAHCKLYKDGKCIKTHAFCDLCQAADEIMDSEGKNTAKRGRSLRSSPYTSVLSKLAENFRSAFRNH